MKLALADVRPSAINQQIALKRIKKLGFSVNAVWNGKEALNYLVQEPSETHPKPDVILMDVQMPILDGYRATHFIRHHKPYSNLPGMHAVPVIAMTASAIQGDREKCRRAGMDDYLAKPVKGKILEKMLVKWATKSRSKSSCDSQHTDHDSNCADASSPDLRQLDSPVVAPNNSEQSRTVSASTRLPGTESEGDRGMRRVEAEEKATALRDDKLLAASESSDPYHRPLGSLQGPARSGPSPVALTEENVGKLGREQGAEQIRIPAPEDVDPDRLDFGSNAEIEVEVGGEGSPVSSLRRHGKANRERESRLSRNDSDRSQRTVTPRSMR